MKSQNTWNIKGLLLLNMKLEMARHFMVRILATSRSRMQIQLRSGIFRNLCWLPSIFVIRTQTTEISGLFVMWHLRKKWMLQRFSLVMMSYSKRGQRCISSHLHVWEQCCKTLKQLYNILSVNSWSDFAKCNSTIFYVWELAYMFKSTLQNLGMNDCANYNFSL